MKNFIYTNSNLSGIGDRLMDIILVYTYSQYLECDNLYLEWRKNDETHSRGFHSMLRKEKTPFRKKDYLIENLLKFIVLPKNIIFVNNSELRQLATDSENIIFNEYMGMTYSVFTFVEKVFQNVEAEIKNKFIENYYDNFKKIQFKNIPENIIDTFKNNEIVTIHLRRGDKMNDVTGAAHGTHSNKTIYLNSITEEFIDTCISQNYLNICFVSDEQHIKNEYIEKYKDKCNIINFQGDEISQTYYDIYCIAHAKKILLSQKFSVFSILGSMMRGNTLYYIFDNGKLIQDKYTNYYNIKHYKTL